MVHRAPIKLGGRGQNIQKKRKKTQKRERVELKTSPGNYSCIKAERRLQKRGPSANITVP